MPSIDIGDISLNVHDAGTGPPILFVHGFPLDHSMWQAQLEELASDHRVIAPDLRGFGANEPTEGTVSMERFADDLVALLDALDVDEPVVYCGLSMGGYIAWPFVKKYAARLRGLILCDTRAGADSAEAIGNRKKMAETVLSDGPEPAARAMIPNLFSRKTLESRTDVVDRVRAMIMNSAPSSIAAALHGMAERPDNTDLLASIDIPTLVVVGAEDKLTTAGEMRKIAATIPDATYVEVPAAGHMAPMEEPGVVNGAMREFLGVVRAT